MPPRNNPDENLPKVNLSPAQSGAKLANELAINTPIEKPAKKQIDLNEIPRSLAINIFNAAADAIQNRLLKNPAEKLEQPIKFNMDIAGEKFTFSEDQYPFLGQLRLATQSAPVIYAAHKALESLGNEAEQYKQDHQTKKLSPDLAQTIRETKLNLLKVEADIKQILTQNHQYINTDTLSRLLSAAASHTSQSEEKDEIFKSIDEIIQGMRGETTITNILARFDPDTVSYRPGEPDEDLKKADILLRINYKDKIVPMSFDVKCKESEDGERFAPNRLDTQDSGEEVFDGITYHQLTIFISNDAIDQYCQIKPQYQEIIYKRMDEIIGLRDLHTSQWRPRP